MRALRLPAAALALAALPLSRAAAQSGPPERIAANWVYLAVAVVVVAVMLLLFFGRPRRRRGPSA